MALAHFVLASDCAQRFKVVFAEVAPTLQRLVPNLVPGLLAVIPAHEISPVNGRYAARRVRNRDIACWQIESSE